MYSCLNNVCFLKYSWKLATKFKISLKTKSNYYIENSYYFKKKTYKKKINVGAIYSN